MASPIPFASPGRREPRFNESLFDGLTSDGFEANAAYMRQACGFVVPELECLHDARGLFAFLQHKVVVRNACLRCHRIFCSVEACRSHMAAKAHQRLNWEDEITLLELAPFYDLQRSASSLARCVCTSAARLSTPLAPLPHHALVLWNTLVRRRVGYIDGLGELVLPSGRSLGHRTLHRVYRQRHKTEDTRVSVVAARANAQANWRTRLGRRGGTAALLKTPGVAAGRGRGALAMAHGALEARLALRAEARKRHRLLLASFAYAKGTSKALASGYVHKADFADNKHARALTHHGYGGGGGGAHYTMAGSKQFQKGVRVKGVVSRHSVQGARLGAARRNKAGGGGGGATSK